MRHPLLVTAAFLSLIGCAGAPTQPGPRSPARKSRPRSPRANRKLPRAR